MKALFLNLVLLVSSLIVAVADEAILGIKPDEVRNIPTVGITELNEVNKAEELAGKVIKLRFNSRGKAPMEGEGKQIGDLGEYNSKTGMVKHVTIEAPIEARAWYYKVTSADGVHSNSFVYARVVGRVDDKVWVKILGRELRNAVTKPEFVW